MRIKSIGRYLVYENGTVYSIKHKRFLKPVLNQKGYGRVDIKYWLKMGEVKQWKDIKYEL